MNKLVNFFKGRFGKYRLRKPFRTYWGALWIVSFTVIFLKYIMFPFFEFWDSVILNLNHLIW